MNHSPRQRKLFADNGPSWSSLSDEQQNRLVDLLAELLLAQVNRRPAVVASPVQREPEEHHDA